MWRPGVAGRQHERLRPILDRFPAVTFRRLRHSDTAAILRLHQPPHERAVVQLDLLRREELLEGEVWRVARTGRADLAGIAAHAGGPAVVWSRVLGLRR